MVFIEVLEHEEHVLIVASVGTSKDIVKDIHFDYQMMFCCNKRSCMYSFLCVTPFVCLECGCLMPFMPL